MYKICLGRIVENKTQNQLKFLDILIYIVDKTDHQMLHSCIVHTI